MTKFDSIRISEELKSILEAFNDNRPEHEQFGTGVNNDGYTDKRSLSDKKRAMLVENLKSLIEYI